MQVRVDSEVVVRVAVRLADHGEAARRLARAAEPLAGEVREPALAEAVRLLGDTCGDVLEVAALDLGLVARSALAGAGLYDTVERGLVQAAGGGPP